MNYDINDKSPGRLFEAAMLGDADTLLYLIKAEAKLNCKDFCGWTALMIAAFNAHSEQTVKLLIDAGADVNSADKDSMSVLMAAAAGGNAEIVKIVTAAGPDLDACDRHGNTALHYIFFENYYGNLYRYCPQFSIMSENYHKESFFKIARHIIDAGADYNKKNRNGMSALMCAAYSGAGEIIHYVISKEDGRDIGFEELIITAAGSPCIERSAGIIEFLISAGKRRKNIDINAKHSKLSRTALMNACIAGNNGAVKTLIASGADPDEKDENNATALMHAAAKGNYENFESLFEITSDPRAVDSNGKTVLDYAMNPGPYDKLNFMAIDKLIKNNFKFKGDPKEEMPKIMFRAAREGNLYVLKLLIDSGTDINCPDWRGWTPLMEAINHICHSGNFAAAEFLIGRGTDLEKCDRHGWNALMLAIEKGHDGLASILIERSPASINQTDLRGHTPLRIAVYEKRYDIIRNLLKNSAIVDAEDKMLETPLHFAVRSNDLDAVKILVENGACVNKKNIYSESPLGISANQNRIPEMTAYLISKGAEYSYEKNNDNERYYLNLIEAGMNSRSLKKEDGAPPLIYKALREGWNELASKLLDENEPLDYKDDEGNNLLMTAAKGKADEKVFRKLIETGFFPLEAANHKCETALSLSLGGDENKTIDLIGHGAETGAVFLGNSPKSSSAPEMTPFLWCIYNGSYELALYILNNQKKSARKTAGKIAQAELIQAACSPIPPELLEKTVSIKSKELNILEKSGLLNIVMVDYG